MEYQNGNYIVRIDDDGTKTRLSDNPIPEYPESIDVKVTNKCTGGCAFCHENSTPSGKSFDVDFAHKLFSDLPVGMELAIGGGNPLECQQDLKWFFRKLPHYGNTKIFPNLTINAMHLDMLSDDLNPNAIGISYRKDLHDKIVDFFKKNGEYHQIVIHLIAGVHTLSDLKKCLEDFDRVLILGYKTVGRGKDYMSDAVKNNLKEWEEDIGTYLNNGDGKIIVFDNLAIEQLSISDYFLQERWQEIYMGDDGQFTMYLDLVEKKFAVSSRSEIQFDIGNMTIKEMFHQIRNIE